MPEPLTLKDTFTETRMFGKRTVTVACIIVVMVVILLWRYFVLQIVEHEVYQTQSDRNRVHIQSVPPKRGLIYDRNGVLLAGNRPSYSLTLIKERISDVDTTLALLQGLLHIEQERIDKFRTRLASQLPFEPVPLKFKLTEEEIAIIAVNRYRLPGVEVKAQLVRDYPRGELFAHALGYVGRISEHELGQIDRRNYSGTYHIGKGGLEKYYEDVLHGSVGYEYVETDVRGKVLRVLERIDPTPGQNLTLYLDSEVQRVAHEALAGERGAVVAIDPTTGGVITIVSTPSYDPNLFVTGISTRDYSALRDSQDLPLFNRSLQGQYPPGSTLKPIFGLAGLHYGVVNAYSAVRDPGWYKLENDDRLYRDWKEWGHGKTVAFKQAIAESCDVYFYDLAFKLGIDRIHDFSAQFGLGRVTGVDQTSERAGLLPSSEWKKTAKRQPWFPGETLSAGIGQGYMLTTPLQLAVATATVASRGIRRNPRLAQPAEGHVASLQAFEPVQLNNPGHWGTVIEAMEEVVHGQKGTAKGIAVGMPYRMAGKTGTAQVIGIKQDEKYKSEEIAKRLRDHALFVGFAPLEAPTIAVAVIVENGEHGSTSAAPIARKVIDAYLYPGQQHQMTGPKEGDSDRG
jgi:penicillin-binding protein 2